MKKFFLFLVLISLISISCKKDDSNPANSTNPDQNAYAGKWKMTISGEATGINDFNISSTGVLSGVMKWSASNHSFTDTLSGTVSKSGELSGSFRSYNNDHGSLKATLYSKQGSGTYDLFWNIPPNYGMPTGTITVTKY